MANKQITIQLILVLYILTCNCISSNKEYNNRVQELRKGFVHEKWEQLCNYNQDFFNKVKSNYSMLKDQVYIYNYDQQQEENSLQLFLKNHPLMDDTISPNNNLIQNYERIRLQITDENKSIDESIRYNHFQTQDTIFIDYIKQQQLPVQQLEDLWKKKVPIQLVSLVTTIDVQSIKNQIYEFKIRQLESVVQQTCD